MIAVGVCIRKFGMTDKKFTTQLTAVIMQVCLPCLIFYSVAYPKIDGQPVLFSLENLKTYGVAVLLGAVAILLGLLAGQTAYWLSKDKNAARILRYGLTLCTYSFVGIPIMESLLGPAAVATYAFFVIPVRVGYYALPEPLMTPPGAGGEKTSLLKSVGKAFLSPQLLAVVIGVVFWVFSLRLPAFVDYVVNSLNKLTTPLALLMCGMLIAEYDFRKMLNLKYFLLPVLRCVMMPAIFFCISLLLPRFGVPEMLCKMFVIYAALPVPSLISVWTVKYDPDPGNHFMAACTYTLSVILCVLTIPIWNWLMG